MGYIATNIARIPSEGFDYYLFLLEDDWNDDLRSELSDNFQNLAKEVGTDTLVVRGANRTDFSYAVFDKYDINVHTVLPALVITDTHPNKIGEGSARLKEVKTILIPLESQYTKHGSISKILKEVAKTLRDKEALDSLISLDKTRIERWWGWLRYLELKPNFQGFGVNINQILDDKLFK